MEHNGLSISSANGGEAAGAAASPAGEPFRAAGGDAVAPPPVSNTGGRLTGGRVKVDWLTLVYPAHVGTEVVAKVEEVMGQGELTGRGMNLYSSSWRWSTGAVLAFSEEGLNAETCCLVMSGGVVDYFTPDALLSFIRWSHEVGARCSRVDVAFDDFSRNVLRMADVHAAADAGNYAGFKVESGPQQPRTRSGQLRGDGRTFGERGKNGGGRQVVFYDKTLESKGEVDAVRMEARYFKKHAHGAFSLLAQAEDQGRFTSQIAGADRRGHSLH